jgi:GNAT superfamily N-acetyltransferase
VSLTVEIHPLTPDRWDDLVTLFGPKGAQEGCWCMYFRQTAKEWKEMKGEPNRQAMRERVDGGEVPGLIAYVGGSPAGWVSMAPRETFVRLETSRILKPVDDEPVWSIVCFFVAKAHRRSGITVVLLKAAVDHAKAHGARIVEGYPVEPKDDRYADAFAYHGLASAFLKAGFTEVARRSEKRPIMRYVVED